MKNSEHVLSRTESIQSFRNLFNHGYNLAASDKYEDMSKGLDCFLEALSLCQKSYSNQNHPDTAKILHGIGCLYRQLGGVDNYLKALDFGQRALEMRQAYYGDKANAEVAESLNTLGAIYRALGGNINKLKSLEFINEALEMRRELYASKAHPNIIKSLYSLAVANEELGSDEGMNKSLALLEQALVMSRSLHDEQPNIDTAKLLSSMAVNYQRLGGIDNLNKALINLQESLDIRKNLGSSIHPDVANNLNNIGVLYYNLSLIDSENKQKHLASNLEYVQKAVDINQELYGNHPHPNLAKSIQDLSLVYSHLGGMNNIKRAYKLQKQALEMYQELYSADHPNIIRCLNNLNYISKHIPKSYDDITLEDTQDLNKDSTDLMGNIGQEKDNL